VHTDQGRCIDYDTLVLATGSYPFVPPIEGNDQPHCHVYRTIEDLNAIKASGTDAQVGVVVGGGLLGLEQPWLSTATCEWLIDDRKIKMLGIGAPGIERQYDLKLPAPDNSPVRRLLLGANVPIAHPLVNIDKLTRDRVFYVGLPMRFTKSEASFIRAIALEEE